MLLAHFTTSEGNFTIRLFDEDAPKTVANFTSLAEGTKEWTDPRGGGKAKTPYFNGTIFHRVISGFMIHKAGILSMANSGPNTNGGQFFITLAATPWLNDKHSVFGEVVEGMDVVKKIGNTQTSKPADRPVTPITIQSVTIERK